MKPAITLILRRMHPASNHWLRYQYGFEERRFEQLARYERVHDERGMPHERFVEFVPSKKPATVFHLLGYGETEAIAKAMAMVNLARLQQQ